MNTLVELLKAIGGLFGVLLVLLIAVLLVVYRRFVRAFLVNVGSLRLRRGNTEIVVGASAVSVQPASTQADVSSAGSFDDRPKLVEATVPSAQESRSSSELVGDLFAAFDARDSDRQEAVYAQLQQNESEPGERLRNEAMYRWLQFGHGDSDALGKLRALAADPAVAAYAYLLAASGLSRVGLYDQSAIEYERSAAASKDPAERARAIAARGRVLALGGRASEGADGIMKELAVATEPPVVAALYEGLAAMYDLSKDHGLRALALEKLLEVRPSDTTSRFKAGYSYGEKQLSQMALLHYAIELGLDGRDGAALNNAGVEFERSNLPGRAITYYRRASEAGNTLGAANLAYSMMNAGFFTEAAEVITRAKGDAEVHPNVGSALSALEAKREEEDQRAESARANARESQRFLLACAARLFVRDGSRLGCAGEWEMLAATDIELREVGDELQMTWKEAGKKRRIGGTIQNSAAVGQTYRMNYGIFGDSELGFVVEGPAYLYQAAPGRLNLLEIRETVNHFNTLMKSGVGKI